jgi:putative oxidoreductase
MNLILWTLQGLMALLFLLSGSMKALRPLEEVSKRMAWANDVPAWFVRFIGIAEILGALGLILPAFTGILPWLTVAAAVGLVIVMLSAGVLHASRREFSSLGITVLLLALVLVIVVGRLAVPTNCATRLRES